MTIPHLTVGHDPGHGWPPAVIGSHEGGILERDHVLELATEVAEGLDWPWLTHRLLRTSNEPGPGCLDYHPRATSALGCDLVICHHVNAYKAPSAHGMIAFYDSGDELGHQVAAAIARAAPAALWRGDYLDGAVVTPEAWPAVHWVMEHYRALGLPCVLIEWGYCTNARDAATLRSEAVRPAMIACVGAGLARAYEILQRPAAPKAA